MPRLDAVKRVRPRRRMGGRRPPSPARVLTEGWLAQASAHYAGSYSATPEARGSAAAFGGPGGGYGSLSPAKHGALSSYGEPGSLHR